MRSTLLILTLISGSCVVKANSDSIQYRSIRHFLQSGEHSGHIRHFFMSTVNEGTSKDYWANALGGALAYHSPSWKGLSFKIEGLVTYNVLSSDLEEKDLKANKASKWEVELFDFEDPSNKYDLDRMDELFIQYEQNGHKLRWGKQIIENPLMNARDGRMKPYTFSGITATLPLTDNISIDAAYVNKVSIRSSVHWYSIEDAIGRNSQGVNTNGSKANYRDSISSKGVGVIGLKYSPVVDLDLQLWEIYLDGLNHSIWFQSDWSRSGWQAGAQLVYQESVSESEIDYIGGDERSFTYSMNLGKDLVKGHSIGVSHTEITSMGRFLFPREFGRERLYSSFPRSWIEGAGGVKATTLKYNWSSANKQWRESVALGYVDMPAVENFELNKYGVGDNIQLNIQTKWKLNSLLEGMFLEFLYIYRKNLEESLEDPALIFNRANFHQFNLITNFKF